MSEQNNGGPAFPAILREESKGKDFGKLRRLEGMSLRDYFAAKALQGMTAREATSNIDRRATTAYEYADAMIKARG